MTIRCDHVPSVQVRPNLDRAPTQYHLSRMGRGSDMEPLIYHIIHVYGGQDFTLQTRIPWIKYAEVYPSAGPAQLLPPVQWVAFGTPRLLPSSDRRRPIQNAYISIHVYAYLMAEDIVMKGGCLDSLIPLLVSQDMDRVPIFPEEDGWHIGALAVDCTSMLDVVVDGFVSYHPTAPFELRIDDIKRISALKGDITIHDGPRLICKSGGLKVVVPTEGDPAHTRAVPNLTPSCRFTVLSDALRYFAKVSDVDALFCEIEVGENLTMTAMDRDIGRGISYTFTEEECQIEEGSCRSAYSLSKVRGLFKVMPKDVPIELALDNDFPVTVSIEGDGWHGKCLMAPCIISE